MNDIPIHEYDAPPVAFLDIVHLTGGVRMHHREIHYRCGSREQGEMILNSVMEDIRESLQREASSSVSGINHALIFWRRRPEVSMCRVYMRFVTSPPLPRSFWTKHATAHGEPKYWGG